MIRKLMWMELASPEKQAQRFKHVISMSVEDYIKSFLPEKFWAHFMHLWNEHNFCAVDARTWTMVYGNRLMESDRFIISRQCAIKSKGLHVRG